MSRFRYTDLFIFVTKRDQWICLYLQKVALMKVINIDKDIMGGKPVFAGTRVLISSLFDYLETGESIDAFLEDFPTVSKEQVVKLLELSQKLIASSTEILGEEFIR